MTRVRVEPGSFDQGRRKNDAFTFWATLPTVSYFKTNLKFNEAQIVKRVMGKRTGDIFILL